MGGWKEKATRGDPEQVIDRVHWLWNLGELEVDLEPGPSLQWYVDRWLSDSNVQLMGWDTRGIHHHLIQVSWKDNRPPGSFPSVEEMRLQAGNLPDQEWECHWRVLSRAWRERHGRIWQPGTCRAYLAQIANRLPRVKAAAERHEDKPLSVQCTILIGALQDSVGALQRYEAALQSPPSPPPSSSPSPSSAREEEPSCRSSPAIKSAQIDRVIEGLNEGVRTLRQLQGRKFRPFSRDVAKRRQSAAELARALGGDAWKVARNVVLHPHYRGDNDRQTEYLDISFPGILKHPEAILELCPSEDPEEFKTSLRAALATARSAPRQPTVTAEPAPVPIQDWRDRRATGETQK